MKILGPASEEDLPEGLRSALFAGPGEAAYCMTCDGLRMKDHECHDPYAHLRPDKKDEE